VTRFKKTARGFTLIELIVVIALIAILTAIAVPGYQTFMVRSRLKGAALHVENGGHTYEIWSDANHDGAVDDNEGVNISKDVQQDYYDVTLSTTNAWRFPDGWRFPIRRCERRGKQDEKGDDDLPIA